MTANEIIELAKSCGYAGIGWEYPEQHPADTANYLVCECQWYLCRVCGINTY